MSTQGTVGSSLLVLSILSGSAGCLPDPRPYDPCIDSQSYYSVAPQGCNGHTVTLLAERKQKLSHDEYIPAANEIIVDAADVYWEGPDGEVLKTSTEHQTTDAVWSPEVPSGGLQLESVENHLYIWHVTQQSDGPTPLGELFVVDESALTIDKVVAAPAGLPPRLQLVENIAYLTTSGINPCLLQVSLDDLAETCVVPGTIERFEVTAKGTFYISSNTAERAIRFLPAEADASTSLVEINGEVTTFDVYGDRVHWIETDSTGFTLRIAEPSGEIGDGQRVPGTLNSATLADDGAYVVGWLDEDVSVSRLYAFPSWSATPLIIAAGFSYVTAMTTYDDALYVSTSSYDNDGSGAAARSFRVSK
ncbi:MAG: hypothetical protein QM784_07410 [Polyangiaceae bacterium]